jgi:hypothetical protein
MGTEAFNFCARKQRGVGAQKALLVKLRILAGTLGVEAAYSPG